MGRDELHLDLKKLIVAELDLRDLAPDEIVDDAALFGEGLGLDSLDALELAIAIEERFGVRVPDDPRLREVFASVRALADYVSQARGPAS
jgi:acyl carrier protein